MELVANLETLEGKMKATPGSLVQIGLDWLTSLFCIFSTLFGHLFIHFAVYESHLGSFGENKSRPTFHLQNGHGMLGQYSAASLIAMDQCKNEGVHGDII
jgi:hypothetical protein